MAFSEDVKKVFHRTDGQVGGSEICLSDRSFVVISGHKGLLSLSDGEIVIRLKNGRVSIVGEGLSARRASPTEIYVEGRIDSISFPNEGVS